MEKTFSVLFIPTEKDYYHYLGKIRTTVSASSEEEALELMEINPNCQEVISIMETTPASDAEIARAYKRG